MAWYDHADNPDALRARYPGGDDLSDVALSALELDRDGPTIRLRFELADATRVALTFTGVRTCAITGWSRTNPCHLELVPHDDHVAVHVYGPGCDIAFTAASFEIRL